MIKTIQVLMLQTIKGSLVDNKLTVLMSRRSVTCHFHSEHAHLGFSVACPHNSYDFMKRLFIIIGALNLRFISRNYRELSSMCVFVCVCVFESDNTITEK